MINEILQFIKKTILSIKLARYDILFLVSDKKAFKPTLWIARWFTVSDSSPLIERIRRFVDDENNLYLTIAVEEISKRDDIVGTDFVWTEDCGEKELNGSVLYRISAEAKDKTFWLTLFREIIVKDFPQLKEQYNGFERRIDIQNDMRLYASGLEELKENASALDFRADYDIDWIRSDKNNLYVLFRQPYRLTSHLSLAEQKNLSRLFSGMLFERGCFISFWQKVAVSPMSEVFFADYDFIYTADEYLCDFARKYAQGKCRPDSFSEHLLASAIRLLKSYCSEVDIFEEWNSFPDKKIPFKISSSGEDLLNHLKKSGVIVDARPKIKHTTYDDVSDLLDSSRHKQKVFSGKSSILYWGPLLIAACFLLWYF